MATKQIDLKQLLEAKMGNITPVESVQQAIIKANNGSSNIPANLYFDAESAVDFKPELVTTQNAVGVRPLSLEEAIEFNARIDECIERLFQEGIDYGTVPNCRTKFLFKAGSEKILNMLGLVARTEIVDKVENYDVGYFSYTCKTWLIDASGTVRAESYAVCNSRENKYAKSNPYNVQNIIIQMSRKRSTISATLTIGNLSNRFSMDEDLVETSYPRAGKSAEEIKTDNKPKADRPATQKQISFLEKLMEQHSTTPEAMNKYVQQQYGIEDYHKINSIMASRLIERFKTLGV